jgi:hypothetical protein
MMVVAAQFGGLKAAKQNPLVSGVEPSSLCFLGFQRQRVYLDDPIRPATSRAGDYVSFLTKVGIVDGSTVRRNVSPTARRMPAASMWSLKRMATVSWPRDRTR